MTMPRLSGRGFFLEIKMLVPLDKKTGKKKSALTPDEKQYQEDTKKRDPANKGKK